VKTIVSVLAGPERSVDGGQLFWLANVLVIKFQFCVV
jgi:hypothetical protein